MEQMGQAQPSPGSAAPPVRAEFLERLRKQYEALICDLLGERLTDEGYQIADQAVALGLWPERLHRPITLHPTTQQRPFFDPASLWFTSYLEENWELVRGELDRVADPAGAGFSTAGLDGSSVRGGKWHQLMLWDRGRRFDRACDLFPATAEMIAAIPEAADLGNGFVMMSWLQPGTWITPHCGPTNSKARTHFCIRADEKARIRVGDQVRSWEEGKCFAFDDSFEHEVWHDGDSPRVVLIIDTPNPWLTDRDVVRDRDQSGWTEEIQTFMASMQLTRIAKEGAQVELTFAEPMVEFVRSYMESRQLESVEFRHGSLRVRPAGRDR
jgi:aspartyl/asparaginyl beta-hydroxylase (cupin superfamily)